MMSRKRQRVFDAAFNRIIRVAKSSEIYRHTEILRLQMGLRESLVSVVSVKEMSKPGYHHHSGKSIEENLWLSMWHPALRWHTRKQYV